MEERKVTPTLQLMWGLFILAAVFTLAFTVGILWSNHAQADDSASGSAKQPRVVYPKKTELDFEGSQIEGEIRNPGEFYFQHRTEEKFDSLVKRRKDFHREMMRDVVLSK